MASPDVAPDIRKARIRWGCKALFAGLLLGLLFSRVDWAVLADTLKAVHHGALLGAIAVSFAVQGVTAFQMWLGLHPLKLLFSVWQIFRIGLIAAFYSLVVPGGMIAGGVASWYKLARPSGKGLESGALVVYFRLLNTVTLVLLGLAGALLDEVLATPVLRLYIVMLLLAVLVALLPFFSPGFSGLFQRTWSASVACLLPVKWRRRFDDLWKVLHTFHTLNKTTLVLIILLSFLVNMLFLVTWYVLALAANLEVSFFVMSWVAALQGILQMVPVTIGGLGIREGSLVALLKPYGVSAESALTLSLSAFGVMVAGALAGGCFEMCDLLIHEKKKGPA